MYSLLLNLPEPMSLHEVLEMNRAEQAIIMNNNNNDNNNDNNNNNNNNDKRLLIPSREEQLLMNYAKPNIDKNAGTTQTMNDISYKPPLSEPAMKIVKNYKRPEERGVNTTTTTTTTNNNNNTDANNTNNDNNNNNNESESGGGGYVISPITGERVLLNDMAEHMRISLIDPRWKQQKEGNDSINNNNDVNERERESDSEITEIVVKE